MAVDLKLGVEVGRAFATKDRHSMNHPDVATHDGRLIQPLPAGPDKCDRLPIASIEANRWGQRRSLLDREQGFDGHGSSIHGQEFFSLGVSLARLFQLTVHSLDKLGVRMASNGNIKRSVGASLSSCVRDDAGGDENFDHDEGCLPIFSGAVSSRDCASGVRWMGKQLLPISILVKFLSALCRWQPSVSGFCSTRVVR